MMLTFSACSDDKNDKDTETVEEDDRDDKDRNDKVRDETAEDVLTSSDTSEADRGKNSRYDNSYIGAVGESIPTEFFTMTVNSANKLSTVSNYVPEDPDHAFLCVNVEVLNTSTEIINVGTYDFTLRWGNSDEECVHAIEQNDFGFNNYPYELDLDSQASVEGNVFFDVPADADKMYFEYVVIYDDDTTGATYSVELMEPEYMEEPENDSNASFESTINYAPIGTKQTTGKFDLTVNDAFFKHEINGEYAENGYAFLGVDVTLDSTAATDIAAGSYYFNVLCGNNAEEWISSIDHGSITDITAHDDLKAGGSLYGTIYFMVPTGVPVVFEYFDILDENCSNSYRVEVGIAPEQTSKFNARQMAANAYSVIEWPPMMEMPDIETTLMMTSIDPSLCTDYYISTPLISADLNEIIICKPDTGREAELQEQFDAHFEYIKNGAAFYPEQEASAAGAVMGKTDDGYLYIIVHENGQAAEAALQNDPPAEMPEGY